MPPRFYFTEEIAINQAIELPIDARHHATRVLRLRTGDIVTLFNGKGGEFSAQIVHITKSNTTVLINKHYDIERESPLIIELAQTICINEKMDWIIQKSVEVGVTHIQPITTDRSVVRLSNERAIKRLLHWQKIVISACEQCGRNLIPQVLPLVSLTNWLHIKDLNDASHNSCFMLSPSATERLKYFPTPPSNTRLTVVVGPEGGFTPEEEKNILRTGFTPLCLGKRILRTESAALATIAAMQTLWGDY